MEVIAVADSKHRWRWEIRHNEETVKESDAKFATLEEAIADGKRHLLGMWTGQDRPPITRRSQRSERWPTQRESGGRDVA